MPRSFELHRSAKEIDVEETREQLKATDKSKGH
jgi:hypothetical protein